MSVQLHVQLTFDDYARAQALHAQRGIWPAVNFFICRTGSALFGLAFLVCGLLTYEVWGDQGLGSALIGSAVFLILYPFYFRLRQRRHFKLTQPLQPGCNMEFSGTGIHLQSATGSGDSSWAAITRSSEDANCFLLYLSRASFLIIPKRFCTQDQIEDLRSMLRANVPAN